MKKINTAEFKSLTGYALVDFSATWCGPCRMLHPVLESAEAEAGIPFYQIDIDEESDLTESLGINSVPTLIIFKDGKPVNKMVGYVGKPIVLNFVKKSI